MSVLYESPLIPSPSLCSAIHPSVSITISQFNLMLTSSHPASFASCGFSFLLFSDFGHDGFAINIDSKADICPFFDFGPGIYSFEAHVRKVVKQYKCMCRRCSHNNRHMDETTDTCSVDGWTQTTINGWMK